MLKMPLPTSDRKKPTFCRTESNFISVASRTAPKRLGQAEVTP